jgi:hypothetical protein
MGHRPGRYKPGEIDRGVESRRDRAEDTDQEIDGRAQDKEQGI